MFVIQVHHARYASSDQRVFKGGVPECVKKKSFCFVLLHFSLEFKLCTIVEYTMDSCEPTAFKGTSVFIGECSLMHFLPRQTPSSYVVIFFSVVSVKSLKHCLTITSLKFFTCVHIFGELKLFSS